MKSQLVLNSTLFRGFIFIIAFCYVISPLKDSVFKILHVASHFVEDHLFLEHTHAASTFEMHSHDAYGEHVTSEKRALANHAHSATWKVIPNHSHNVLAVLDSVISSEEDDHEHQKPVLKVDLDKHLVASGYVLKKSMFRSDSKKIWHTLLMQYDFNLPILSPPPRNIS
ncbi:hypothetical protein Q4566_09395 [Tamlana sp. 2_MG-2023]|uniref:hypothetical protein n=1 Tax=unclassified Tamlana TaxID=2614803 RepID=UPI0026E20A4B|nr:MULTISPECIES: hypothetical protein [unclassified Tamlana]MDO6760410.1 hypothetical protein [Tamlana sp. 2_MG-2023]MDO6789891.1 hypothetical protein [Tamlana sp. 1_MG-2023]